MNRQLVFAENKTLFLDTSMQMDAFTKSRMADKMGEEGYLAEKTDDGWRFSPWAFTGTRQNECNDESLSMAARKARETVLFEGPAFSGRTLKALFDLDFSKELGETEISFVTYAAARVCSVLEESVKQKIDVSNIGAGGIFISADYKKVIFLPRGIFELSVTCAGHQAASEYNGLFINPLLKSSAAVNYTQSVIAYRMLTGTYPFGELETSKRYWDIIDHNYVPLKNKVWALDEKLSFFVDNALQRKGRVKSHGKKKGEKKHSVQEKISSMITEADSDQIDMSKPGLLLAFPLEELYKETGLTEKGEIPAGGNVHAVIRKGTVSPDQFEKKSRKENEAFQKKLSKKRWLRSHRTHLTVAACAVLAAVVVSAVIITGNGKNPTSKGLSSLETVQMFYSAFNALDITGVQGCSSGHGGDEFIDLMTSEVVSSGARSLYNVRQSSVSPAEWFCFNYDLSYNIFGVSNFFIDGVDGDIFFKGPQKKTHPKSISEEYGMSVAEGATKDYKVTYSLVQSQMEDDLIIINQIDEVHLLFYRGRWVITSVITHEGKPEKISFASFKDDFKSAWEKAGENPNETAAMLRSSYEWIPTDIEIDGGKKLTEDTRDPLEIK